MRSLAVAKRIILEMSRDKRTLALLFVAPLVIFSLMYFLFQTTGDQSAHLLVRTVDTEVVDAVSNKHVKIKKISSSNESSPEKLIRKYDSTGMIEQDGDKITVTLANSDQGQTGVLMQSMQKAQVSLKMKGLATTAKSLQAALVKANPQFAAQAAAGTKKQIEYSFKNKYLYGDEDSTYFQTLMPVLLGFIVFFLVFLISGTGLLKERTSGTLARILATPIKRSEIVFGYVLGYGFFAVLQTVWVVLMIMFLFKIEILGNLAVVILINLCVAAVALTLGLLISSFAKSEFQMMQFIPLIIVPQVFFAGIIPVTLMPDWVQYIAKIMPLYYGANSLTNVIQKGQTILDIAPNLLILILLAAAFLILNIFSMRKYRQV